MSQSAALIPVPARAVAARGAPPRTVIITGGSSGIGLCTALLFARRGWRVGLIARGETALAAAAERIRKMGGRVETAQADVADSAALARAAASLEAALGPVEVWINNAGTSIYSRFSDIEENEFRRVVDVTFMGQVNGTRVALASMRPRRRGTIVGIGSAVAYRGIALQSPYSASKYALRGFYEALRTELLHDRSGIHLAVVHPPSVNTPFFSHAEARITDGEQPEYPRPVPPVYQPEIIADAIWLAVSERRRDVRVSGTTLQFAIANALVPGLLDRFTSLSSILVQRTRRQDVAARRDPGLFDVPKGTAAIHGSWGGETRETSGQMWLQRNRYPIGLAGLAILVAARAVRPRQAR